MPDLLPEVSQAPVALIRAGHTEKHNSRVPSVSVALCTYNGARYLGEQLCSLAAQTQLPHELIVSDDGSTDGTVVIVEDFAQTAVFPVRLVRQPINLGVTQNFSEALALCRGEFVALCDQDDMWLPDKLAAGAEYLEAHPEHWAVFSDAALVDQTLHPLPGAPSLWQSIGLGPDLLARIAAPDSSLQVLSRAFYVTGATLLVRRELLRLALPIPQGLPGKMLHDGWLAVVAAALGKIGYLPRSTMLYRQHAAQQVGAGQPPSARRSLRAPRERFLTTADHAERLHTLLTGRLTGAVMPSGLNDIRRRAAHFRLRGQLPAARWRRVGPISGEWRRGYRHYARHPWLEMWRDLIF